MTREEAFNKWEDTVHEDLYTEDDVTVIASSAFDAGWAAHMNNAISVPKEFQRMN